MRKVLITAVLLSIAVVSPLLAQDLPACPGAFALISGELSSPQDYTVSWPAIAGARFYIVEETRPDGPRDTIVTRQFVTSSNSVRITHESINDVTYQYRIRNIGPNACETLSQRVRTLGDPVLRQAVRRGIVPVVGSARGANGSLFKTFLRLEGTGMHGRIIFHPAGGVISNNDPSIAYDLRSTDKVEWDDVVAAIGQSGIGSLSIVPAEGELALLPRATVRLYNVASNGIYGTNAEMYPGVDFLEAHAPFQRIEVPADGNFRVNVGARAVMSGTARGFAITKDGLQKRVIERTFAAGETVFGSPEAVYGVSLEPGESLSLTFSRAMIPFYTLTDNRTNDPFLHVQGAERTDVVDQYAK